MLTLQDLERITELVRRYEVPMVKITSAQRLYFQGLAPEKRAEMMEELGLPDSLPHTRNRVHYVQAYPGQTWCKFGTAQTEALAKAINEMELDGPLPYKVKVGISGERETYTAVEHSEAAKERGITRASMGMINLREKLDGAIVAIGNAPSAAITLCELIEEGVRPAVVVGTPVGFVNAAESKEMIRGTDVPSITCVGTRGGSTLCVAMVNGLINLARSRQTP